MATRKIYAIRYKKVAYSGGKFFNNEFIEKVYKDLEERLKSIRDPIEAATCSLKKAKQHLALVQELNKFDREDDSIYASRHGWNTTFRVTIRYYYIDELPSI